MSTDPPGNLLVGASSTGFDGDNGIDGTDIPLRNQRDLDLSLERFGREKVDHWLPTCLFYKKVELVPVLKSHFLDCGRCRATLGFKYQIPIMATTPLFRGSQVY